jgi:hypothetical protein
LDIPEVLTADPMDDWTPRPRRRRVSRALPVQYGPSFKALAVSTVLLALAGTGAIALGLPDLMVGGDPDVVQVETQTITAVPKGDLTNSVSNTPSTGASQETPKTFTKAQDRIHQAFAETETNATHRQMSWRTGRWRLWIGPRLREAEQVLKQQLRGKCQRVGVQKQLHRPNQRPNCGKQLERRSRRLFRATRQKERSRLLSICAQLEPKTAKS